MKIAYLLKSALAQVLLIASPVLIASLLVGLVAAILQAATSVQDQVLSFVPKVLAVLAVLFLLGTWMSGSMRQFALSVFSMIPEAAR